MQEEISIKQISDFNIENEIESVGFDSLHVKEYADKYEHKYYKIYNLKSAEANILKQLCLSLGFDCAVNKDVITAKCQYSNCIISGSVSQFKKLVEKLKLQPFRLKFLAEILCNQLTNQMESLTIRNKVFDWKQTYIMGILNITPDSFSDGGKYFDIESATTHAKKLINDGADIIDIGGESTRPNAKVISPEEEIQRILPIIESIRKIDKDIVISIDTRNYETAKAAFEAGADILNDVSGLDYDKEMLEFATENNLPVIVMHSNIVPAQSSIKTGDAEYDVVEEIYKTLSEKVKLLKEKGLNNNQIIIDPGIGFGKSPNDSFKILKRIKEFESLKCPILVGISRKSFISKTFDISDKELDYATSIYDSFLIAQNVNIIRVHNVSSHKKNIELLSRVL